jgi:hypothetical protein
LTYNASSQFQVGSSLTYRPNLTGQTLIASGDSANYINKNAVVAPTDRSNPFGNAGRNILSGPNFLQADLGLHKSFPVFREGTRLEFRMEAFNLFNRTNFQVPDGNVSNSTFGTITTAFPARQVQFALKLNF